MLARTLIVLLSGLAFGQALVAEEHLPRSVTFKGEATFRKIVAKAKAGQWHRLPMGERVARFAKEIHGTPYQGYTLEIDDRIESPSVNFEGMDCWTFFETSLGLARMVEGGVYPTDDPGALLRQIETTRYRGGVCRGHYLDRLHYLAEWYSDNDRRGTVQNITRQLGGNARVTGRKCQEMTTLWKSYRYLRCNPALLKPMAKIESQVSQLPVYYIPKSQVRSIESKLKDGDVIGIVTKYQGGFCSHVGIVYHGNDGKARFMHASTSYKRVVIDSTVSGYLDQFSKHIGIIVGRPL